MYVDQLLMHLSEPDLSSEPDPIKAIFATCDVNDDRQVAEDEFYSVSDDASEGGQAADACVYGEV